MVPIYHTLFRCWLLTSKHNDGVACLQSNVTQEVRLFSLWLPEVVFRVNTNYAF